MEQRSTALSERNQPCLAVLLADARRSSDSLGELLQLYRNYLTILASTQINARLRRRISPSDLVQEAERLEGVRAVLGPGEGQFRQVFDGGEEAGVGVFRQKRRPRRAQAECRE